MKPKYTSMYGGGEESAGDVRFALAIPMICKWWTNDLRQAGGFGGLFVSKMKQITERILFLVEDYTPQLTPRKMSLKSALVWGTGRCFTELPICLRTP